MVEGFHSQPTEGVFLEIKLNQDGRLLSYHPAVVPWFYGYHLRGYKVLGDAIGVLNLEMPFGQETQVRMHAQVCAYNLLHVSRPSEPDWVNHPLYPRISCFNKVHLNTTNAAMLSSWHRCQ